MKKLSLYVFLVLTFFFTTAGVFKSDLEECADFKVKSWIGFNRTEVFKTVPLTEEEQEKANEIYEAEMVRLDKEHSERHKCERKKGGGKISSACVDRNEYYFWAKYAELARKSGKEVKVRDISEYENKREYKKYINMSLKKKLRFADSQGSKDWLFGQIYEGHYLTCVKEKKNNPELFKGKYD